MERLELTILRNLIHNEDYARKVIPFINLDYFDIRAEQVVCQEIIEFIAKYNKLLTTEVLEIEIQNRSDLTETELKELQETISSLKDSEINDDWLLDATEKWCRDRAIYLALMSSIKIADGQDDKKESSSLKFN